MIGLRHFFVFRLWGDWRLEGRPTLAGNVRSLQSIPMREHFGSSRLPLTTSGYAFRPDFENLVSLYYRD